MSAEWHPEKFNEHKHNWTVKQLWKAAFLVERDAKILCPVDTGRLRASLTSHVDEKNEVARVESTPDLIFSPKISVAGSPVYYAIFVELGTYKMTARPFLTPALEMNKPAIRRLFGAK